MIERKAQIDMIEIKQKSTELIKAEFAVVHLILHGRINI